MNILVTGASGFIGSHITKRLYQDKSNNLTLVDNFSRGKKSYLKYLGVNQECINADLMNPSEALRVTKDMDMVFHFAARIGGEQFVHGSVKNEMNTLYNNFTMDSNIFRACIENKVKKILFPSSVSVYSTRMQKRQNCIFKESDFYKDIDPEGGYGWAKYLAETQLQWMKKIGIQHGVARIFKTYGPCDDYSEKSGQVVCSLFRKAILDNELIIWGTGESARCLCYIDDIVDAFIRLSKYNGSLAVNIGTTVPTKIRELAQLIIKTTGRNIPLKLDITKGKESPLSRIPDLSLAKEKLGWVPTTSLEDGLKKVYEWMQHELL